MVSGREDPARPAVETWAQFLLNCSRTVALVCSNSHCWVGEEGRQAFMKTLRSLSLQSMQLPLTGWYRVLSCKTPRLPAGWRWGSGATAAQEWPRGSEAGTGQLLVDLSGLPWECAARH